MHFSDNFDDGNLTGWTNYDNDADPTSSGATDFDKWYNSDFSSYFPELGAGTAVSRSWASINSTATVLHPNNFLISPAINLTAVSATGLRLFFNTGTIEPDPYDAEHYAVYVTTSNDPAQIILATPVFEETLTADVMTVHSIDLAAFAGQTVYVTVRHFNSVDMNTLLLDDVKVVTLLPNDVSLASASLNRYSATSTNNTLALTIKNEGFNAVTGVTVDWNDGTAHSATIPVNIASQATATINHPISINYATVVEKSLNINITQVNGGADDNTANNTGTKPFNTVSAVAKKHVVIEEGTGTWCGWCPRGAVAMEYMDQQTAAAGDFIGVAVHNADPMTVTEYDNGANFGGYPSCNVDRVLKDQDVGNTQFLNYYNSRKTVVTPGEVSATVSQSGSNYTINATFTSKTVFANANFRLGAIIIEDNVTGTANGYNQTNYYSSTSQNIALTGAGHNWQTSANPVPAASMEYDHVGRALLGGYNGQTGSVATTITDGQAINYTFNYTVPAGSLGYNMKAIVVLIDQATGEIANAVEVPFSALGVNENIETMNLNVYPNPATENLTLNFTAEKNNYTITLTDLAGRTVYSNELSNVSGEQSLTIPVNEFKAGTYLVTVANNNSSFTQQVVIK